MLCDHLLLLVVAGTRLVVEGIESRHTREGPSQEDMGHRLEALGKTWWDERPRLLISEERFV